MLPTGSLAVTYTYNKVVIAASGWVTLLGIAVTIKLMTMRLLLLALTLLGSTSLMAQELPYRLAGISYSEGGPSWAVIEMADGTQRLLREGIEFDQATKLARVGEHDVDLLIDGQRYTIRLDRGDAVYKEPAQLVSQTIYRDWTVLQQALHSAAQDSKLNQSRLNGLFGLSKSVRISAVNHNPAKDAKDALKLMLADNGNEFIRLEWESADGPMQMYVMPAIDGLTDE